MYYQVAQDDAATQAQTFNATRFVSIADRRDRCDIPEAAWAALLENAVLQTWQGITLKKGITELALYPMLIQELRPKTIIEIGAFYGGSAVWLADCLALSQIDGQVYSLDIDLSLLDQRAAADARIRFVEGDCYDLATSLTPAFLATLPHPWLVIEDAHTNIAGVCEYFHQHGLQSGDYLIVEDTNPYVWSCWQQSWQDKIANATDPEERAALSAGLEEESAKGTRKLQEYHTWLQAHHGDYVIDGYYQDLYGYNGSKNWNSFLKRC